MGHHKKLLLCWIVIIFTQILWSESSKNCDICTRRGVKKCPQDILKGTYCGVFPDKKNSAETEDPDSEKFVDLMMGILKSMHRTSQSDLRRARQKEITDNMLRWQERRFSDYK